MSFKWGFYLNFNFKENYAIDDLRQIMQILRSDDGCPWDKEQTHSSIRKNLIEETYEVCEAIDTNDVILLKEELGDVLLQVVFHSQMEEELNNFTFDDVVDAICKKLIVRHPHVFSTTSVNSVDEVLENWTSIKTQTKGQTTSSETLTSVPTQLPALMRCDKVQGRAKKANSVFGIFGLDDLKGELDELEQAIKNNDIENIAEEIGDCLYACVGIARLYNMDAEELLTASTNKFINRFSLVEKYTTQLSIQFSTATHEQLDELWKRAKKELKENQSI